MIKYISSHINQPFVRYARAPIRTPYINIGLLLSSVFGFRQLRDKCLALLSQLELLYHFSLNLFLMVDFIL